MIKDLTEKLNEKSPSLDQENRLSELEKENEELRRQLALCTLCNKMCSPQEHGKRLAELKKDRDLMDNLIHSIGRKEK